MKNPVFQPLGRKPGFLIQIIPGARKERQAGTICHNLLIINLFFPQIVNIYRKQLLMRFSYICPFRKKG